MEDISDIRDLVKFWNLNSDEINKLKEGSPKDYEEIVTVFREAKENILKNKEKSNG